MIAQKNKNAKEIKPLIHKTSFKEFKKKSLKTSVIYKNKISLEPKILLSHDRATLIFKAPPTSEFTFFNEQFDDFINARYLKENNSKVDEGELTNQLLLDDKGFYHYNRKITESNGDIFFLSWGFKEYKVDEDGFINETVNNIRIDCNFNKINMESLSYVLSKIHYYSFKFRRYSREDIAIDYFCGIDLTELYDTYLRTGCLYFENELGITTKYLGSKLSNRQLRFYNKQYELLKKESINLDIKCTRFEVQLRNNWHQKDGVKNPFEYLKMYQITSCSDYSFGLILKEVEKHGLDVVLSNFKTSDKRKYMRKKIVKYLKENTKIIHPKLVYNQCYNECFKKLEIKLLEVYKNAIGVEKYNKFKKLDESKNYIKHQTYEEFVEEHWGDFKDMDIFKDMF